MNYCEYCQKEIGDDIDYCEECYDEYIAGTEGEMSYSQIMDITLDLD